MTSVDAAVSGLMSQAEYARHRDCSREAVRKAVEAGRITTFGDEKRINAKLADIEWAQNTRARVGSKPPPEGASAVDPRAAPQGEGVYWESRARREKAEADMAELKLKEQLGELVRAADVRAEVAKRAAAMREALMQLPARLSPVLAAESDTGRVHDQLQAELRLVLEQLTDC